MNTDEEFWHKVYNEVMQKIAEPLKWHIRWKINIINTHSFNINDCYRVLFNPQDQECGNGIVEECNCKAGERKK